MLRKENLENIKREMARYKLNILDLCETRRNDQGDFWSDEVRVTYSGGKEIQRGVAILLDKKSGQSVTKITFHSDRTVTIKRSFSGHESSFGLYADIKP